MNYIKYVILITLKKNYFIVKIYIYNSEKNKSKISLKNKILVNNQFISFIKFIIFMLAKLDFIKFIINIISKFYSKIAITIVFKNNIFLFLYSL